MVISFSVKEARDQLLNNGVVYTFRWNKRKTVGKNWANEKRGGKKIADVNIELVGEYLFLDLLLPYVNQSGFKTLNDWASAIMDMQKKPGHYGYLYKVTLNSQQLRTVKE